MPPTVKSLEERLDEFGEELAEVKTALTSLTSGQAATQVQLAGFGARLDALTDKLNTTQAQIATLTSSLNASQAQLALLTARIEALTENLRTTNTRLEDLATKLNTITTEHTTLKAKTDTTLGIVKWIGGFGAGVLVTVILAAFTVARTAGSYEATLQQQQKTLDEIKRDIGDIRTKQK